MCKLLRTNHKLSKALRDNTLEQNSSFVRFIDNISNLKPCEEKYFISDVHERWGSHLENSVSSKLCFAKS